MTRSKVALIIGTIVATNGFESGAMLRLNSLKYLVESSGFTVTTTSRTTAIKYLESEWDLVVLVSFSTSSLLRLARRRSKFLWFDPTDSWTLSRLSLLRSGDLKQGLALLRDLYFIWTSPKIDLITFVTERDLRKERSWWSKRSTPLILSIEGLDREIESSRMSRLVFFGDGRYRPNQKALKFLVRTLELLPSDIHIHLIGKNLTGPNKNFISHGYLTNQKMYFLRDIHLAPIRHGGGLKLKVAIPLWNGLRVISTSEGSNGFKDSSQLKIANSPYQFAAQISEMLKEDFHGLESKPRNQIYLKNQLEEVRLRLTVI